MKNLIILIFILTSKFSFGQPNPQERYPERIKAITEQLKTDSLNYELIWERLVMKVNLMGGFGTPDEIFSLKVDSIKTKRGIVLKKLYRLEDNPDFTLQFVKSVLFLCYTVHDNPEKTLHKQPIWLLK